ncbi:MAG: hypothetical protein QXM75_03795 [Candidatus Diapherotrites archaeon]
MREETISDYKTFKQKIKIKNEELEDALKRYFELGGVVRLKIVSAKEWPELVYPSKSRLQHLISERESTIKDLERQKAFWNKRLKKAERYYLAHFFKKYTKPIYWKHMLKFLVDKEYREDAKKVNIPVHLAADERWEPMIKTFVENEDYRKQLRTTFEESPIYKKNKKLANYSDQILDFRKQEAMRQIKEIDKKLEPLKKDIVALKKLLSWAK